MKNTIIYLIRHSEQLKFDGEYNSEDDEQTKNEKIVLSAEGEEKAKLLSKLGITINNVDMICYSTKPLTLSIYNTLYMWLNGNTCNSMSFYRYYYLRYKKQSHLIQFFNNFIMKFPKYRELFSQTINEEE